MAKQSSSWKVNERATAEFFGVKRKLRGADFSQEDVEIVVPIADWSSRRDYNIRQSPSFLGGLVVECKYRQASSCKLPTLFKEVADRRPDKRMVPIALLGNYVLSWMEEPRKSKDKSLPIHHFDLVWNYLVCDISSAKEFVKTFYVEWLHKKSPKYLADWMEQAKRYQYREVNGKELKFFPVVEICTAGKPGRLMIWEGPFGVGL